MTQEEEKFVEQVDNWLKSLKDSVQPKQEWKQENTGDLTDFENAMMCVGNSFFGQYAGLDPNDTNAIKEQANLLLELVPSKEWSEEDEDNFKHLMDEIVCLGNSRNSANRLHYDRLIKFLDELKNRVQPREEWCDKDERMLDRLIAYFEKRVAFTNDDNPRYANWLKSLRPRTQWKPSEEQIKVLAKASETYCGKDKGVLYSLYNDLKKLKG